MKNVEKPMTSETVTARKSFVLLLAGVAMAGLLAAGPARAQSIKVPTAGCDAILTPEVIAQLKAAKTDPLADYQAWRQSHPNAIAVSLPVQCRHEAWVALHGQAEPAQFVPAGTAGGGGVNVPTPGCDAVLTPDTIAFLQAKATDPMDDYEAYRQAHPHMIEVSMPTECWHEAWLILHGKMNPPASPPAVVTPGPPQAPSIGANIDMARAATGVTTYQGEEAVAVNPNNPLQMVASANTWYRDPTAACQSPTGGSANTYGTMALYGSTDGGATWTYNCAPWPATDTGSLGGPCFGSDPAVGWDNAGHAFAVYMLISLNAAQTAQSSSLVIAESLNSGTTWVAQGVIANTLNSSASFDDKELMAVDWSVGQAHSFTNRIYVIWDRSNTEQVAHADPPYTAWTRVTVGTNTEIGGNLTVGADGTVYAVWNRYSTTGGVGTGDAMRFRRSTDGGTTWSAVLNFGQHNLASFGANNAPPAQNSRKINCFPSIDIDRNPASAFVGRLYIVYDDFPAATGSGSDVNIYEIRSIDNGATWSAQLKVNDDAGTTTQFFPWMGVDQTDGTVDVSWYDARNSTGGNSRRTQMFGTRSTDGGVSFEPNLLIEDTGANFTNNTINYSDENTTDNTAFNPNQYGDYSGMAAVNRQAHPLWCDTRNFYPTAGDTRIEDSATALVTFCTAPTGVVAPTLACSGSQPVVTWSAPASWGTNATGGTYSVIRFTDAACTLGRTVLSTTATSPYTDGTAVAGTTYYYEITATNNCPGTVLTPMSATSTCSASITCSACALGAPSGVTATATADAQITVAWNTVGGATSYTILHTTGACPGAGYTTLASGIVALSYADNTVIPGTTYSYEVQAVAGCTSSASACANAVATGVYSTGMFVSGRPQNTTSAGAGFNTRWIFNTNANALAPPGIRTAVYACSNDRYLHSMAWGNGAGGGAGTPGTWPTSPSVWKPFIMNAPSQARPPIVATAAVTGGSGKYVFLGSQDGHVYCVDANTGAQIWQSAILGDYVQGAANGMFTVFAGAYNLIIVGTRNSSAANVIDGLNVSNGTTAWTFNNGGGANSIGIISSGAQIDYTNNKVYFTSRTYSGGSQQTVWCLSFTGAAASPCTGWAPPATIGNVDSAPLLFNGRLYIGDNTGRVWALSASTGAALWTGSGNFFATSDGPIKGFISSNFAVSATQLYFSTNGKLWALTDNGTTVAATAGWPVATIANPSGPLYLPGVGYLLAGSSDGALHQINVAGMAQVSATLGGGLFTVGSPTLDTTNNMVYVGTTGGDVYAAVVPLQ
jgi:outer membrane protein assembly factor BamB